MCILCHSVCQNNEMIPSLNFTVAVDDSTTSVRFSIIRTNARSSKRFRHSDGGNQKAVVAQIYKKKPRRRRVKRKLYSASSVRNLASGFVSLMLSCSALSMIAFLFLAETLCAISAGSNECQSDGPLLVVQVHDLS
jgi:hypothetical protein